MDHDTTAGLKQYTRAWQQKMIEIWRDRLDLLQVRHTGALYNSLRPAGNTFDGQQGDITFQFLQYGLYVDLGTGNGYRRGNNGNLQFLGKEYRQSHRLGRKRQKKPWFSPSWAISIRVLADKIQQTADARFIAMLDNL